MQYLSKAYNYYSGINPATLSGAIDVIVVRHVDNDGVETLSSSPFHVRFGKLQVLRAGEKRVTIKLPNNLPSPHVAPFSMKVGETGEAFFVLETDEEVPADLLTSPVVMPAEGEEVSPPASPPTASSTRPDDNSESKDHVYVTQEPFGDTEKQFEKPRKDALDADILDLNDSVETLRKPNTAGHGPATPSSLLKSLPSIPSIPSIPFLSSGNDDGESSESSPPKKASAGPNAVHSPPSQAINADQPPNPMTARPGEQSGLPDRDDKLSEADVKHLPPADPEEGEGPSVRYGKNVVLDMSGYHASSSEKPEGGRDADTTGPAKPVVDSLISTLTQDLTNSAQALTEAHRPHMPSHRATEPPISDDVSTPSDEESEPDIGSLSLNVDRHARATSEPPESPPRLAMTPSRHEHARQHSPVLRRTPNGAFFPSPASGSSAAAMDLAWDWSKMPVRDDASVVSVPTGLTDVGEGRGPTHGRLKNVEENPHLFVLEVSSSRTHTFELSLCGSTGFAPQGQASSEEEAAFLQNRVTFQQFIEDPQIVDDPDLVVRYSLLYLSWTTGYDLLFALSMYRRGLLPPGHATSAAMPPLADLGVEGAMPTKSSGYGWSRWWRRGQSSTTSTQPPEPPAPAPAVAPDNASAISAPVPTPAETGQEDGQKYYAKTLRLSSDQLKELNLHKGANTVQFSVTSSYSGFAVCSARIFLWESTDQVVISDIDGTITKSDALGHVFAAIGRDWTHLGIARLYTDIANNGYKMLYLTSRAIGQADTTREYLRSINQGDYRMPEGPVIMSPDRLMASLHREVIMRKPELFKMACLRDIQRLFGPEAKTAFYAGFGNRITDAMSYRSVAVAPSKIYTIDSTGVVKTELLQSAGHKGSYILLNDLVNEVFPPVSRKEKPEFSDFNYWRSDIIDIPLPDLSPPSPALSARSDSSMSVLSKIIGRRSSRQPILPTNTSNVDPSSRPSSPLIGPAMTPDDTSGDEDDDVDAVQFGRYARVRRGSMPGSYDGDADADGDDEELMGDVEMNYVTSASALASRHEGGVVEGGIESAREYRDKWRRRARRARASERAYGDDGEGEAGEGDEEDGVDADDADEEVEEDYEDDDAIFDDDLLATGEMRNVPF